MNRPDYISIPDWNLLTSKYSLKKLEKYFNKSYPYQYLIGNVEFYHTNLIVNKNVLIPRWETEQLVDIIINKIKNKKLSTCKGIDICTGSGCIAINLANELQMDFIGIDISKKALKIAKQNALINKSNVEFKRLDILKENLKRRYSLVVCNPPYLSYNEKVGKETKYEPQHALFANNEGLEFYENILNKIKPHLEKEFLIAFEIGANQQQPLKKIANNYFFKSKIYFQKDYNNKTRFMFIENGE